MIRRALASFVLLAATAVAGDAAALSPAKPGAPPDKKP
jgi:hypothetical protein